MNQGYFQFFSRLLFLLLLVGCSFSESRIEPGKSESSKKETTPREWTISFVSKGTTQNFWKTVHAGAVKAAQEEKIKLLWDGPTKEDDRLGQIQMVQNSLSRQVDALILIPQDSRALVPVVQSLVKKKLPVVLVNSGLDGDHGLSFVATDNYAAGQKAAERMSEVLKAKGRVAVLKFFEGSQSTTQREKGFLETLKKMSPNIQIVSEEQYAGVGAEKAFQAAQNLLNRLPELDGIFCPNESVCQGVLRAVQVAKRKLMLVGFDASELLKEALKKKEFQGLVVQSPFNQGYLGVKTAAAILRGEKVEPRVDTGVVLATPENMNEASIQEHLNPDIKRWLKE